MSRGRSLKEHDLPVQMAGASAAVVNVTGGGGGGTSTNADTVDGYHAGSSRVAGTLLALDAAAQFPASVIDWSKVSHADLADLTAGNPHTQYVNAASGGITKTGQGVALAATVAGDGLDLTAGVLSVKTGTGVRIVSDAVAIDTHTHQDNDQGGVLDHGAALTGLLDDDHTIYALVNPLTSARNTIQAGADDVTPITVKAHSASQSANLWEVEDSTGAVLLQVNEAGDLESADFQSGIRGWQVSHGGTAEFHNAYVRGELHATVFVKDLIEAHAGTLGIFKSGGKLHADFTTPAIGATATLTVTDPPGGGFLFSANDWVRVKAEHASGVYDVWGQVTAPADNGDGTQSYTYTHRSGTAGALIPAGVAVSDYGASGQGYLLATADLNYAPYLDVASWAGADPYTGGNHTVHVRLGLLDGLSGIGAEWGLWAGKDSSHYLQLTDTTALIRGIKQQWVDSGDNIRGEVDPEAGAGDYLFWLGPSSGDKRFAVAGDGTVYIGNVPSANVAGWAHASDLTKIDGGKIEAGSIVLSGLDPGGQLAGQNLLLNSSFLEDSDGNGIPDHWTANYGFPGGTEWSASISGNTSVYDGLSFRVEARRNHASGGYIQVLSALVELDPLFAPGKTFAGAFWVYKSVDEGAADYAEVLLTAYDASQAYISHFAIKSYSDMPQSQWKHIWCSGTAPAGTVYIQLTLRHHQKNDGELARIYVDGATLSVGQYPIAWSAAQRGTVFIDGSKVRVGARNGTRVEINSEGVAGYSDLTTKQFYLDATSGRGMFGAGHGVIDANGLALDGDQTSVQSYASVRWLTDPDNSASTEVAKIAAGRFYEIVEASAYVPHLYMVVNRTSAYNYSKAEIVGYGSASDSYNQMLLDYGYGYASAILRTVNGGSTRAEVVVNRDQLNNGSVQVNIEGTTRLTVNSDGAVATRFASYTGTFTGTAATHSLVAPGNGMYLLCASPDDTNWRLIEWLRVRGTTVSSLGNVTTSYLSLTSSGGTVQIANSNAIAQTVRWCLIRLAN